MWVSLQLLFCSVLGPILSVLFATGEVEESNLKREHNIQNTLPLTQEEFEAIEKFRPMVRDVLERDYESTTQFLIRWIRASNFKLETAEQRLRETQQWKKDIGLDELLKEGLPPFLKNEICVIDGVDYGGNQIVYVRLNDVRKALTNGHRQGLIRELYKCIARVQNSVNELGLKTGKDNIGGFIIADAKNYNIKQHACLFCFTVYTELTAEYEKNFPDLVKYSIIVNAPGIIKPLAEIIKPLMSEATRKGLHVFGNNPKQYTPFLLSHINSNELSTQYGGRRNISYY